MNARRPQILAVCRTVRKYWPEMVLLVETDSTSVPLVKMGGFPRLLGNRYLTVVG
jgi:hypothetical protein